jgi:pentatricopeptide repeat domain-containing protein 1
MGWGGRPLAPQQHQTQHPQHHYQPQHHPHQPQQPQRRRSMDEFSPTPFHQPHGATSNSHNNNGYAPSHRGPRPSHHQGNGSGSARGRSHPGAPQQLHQPQQQQQQQQQHQQQHAAGGPGAQQHPRGPGCGPAGPGDARAKGQGYRRLWQQVTAVGRGGRLGEGEAPPHGEVTVEDLLECVRRLPPDASAVKAVAQGLYFLDSGALAALLKELNKAGHARRAQEIFDWLRALDPAHDLYPLSNTMTYTTMISQCGSQQALRRALELVAEMRGRGVQCNVHTYSALMNVCIKASELELAQDVYRQMLAEGCTPNLVTYNTLIDVHGKTGAWEAAVAVLDTLEAAGIQPEVRTYNTVIIACNQSSRAAEALAVYERMLAAGAQPTATTYTALISAYGKAGQLDAALQIFQDMVRRGCERNVITYSSLISACEKVRARSRSRPGGRLIFWL